MNRVEFERRVLEEARDRRNPLLERVKFLGILGRNLDEFVMVRGREWLASAAAKKLARKTHALLRDGNRVLKRELLPALAAAGIDVVPYDSLSAEERAACETRFVADVLPLLAPQFCDAGLTTAALGLNLAAVIDAGETRIAVVRVPDQISSLVPIDQHSDSFVWLHEVIAANLHHVFPGAQIRCAHRFRIVRDADIVLDAVDADTLPRRTLEAVRQRETNPVLMLVIDRAAARSVVDRLAHALDVRPEAVVMAREVLDFNRLWDFSQVQRADLRYPAFVPKLSTKVAGSMFNAVRRRDILLHHPFEPFDPVVRLAREAAADAHVERVAATLYRTDRGESHIVEALLDAARAGKDVRVVVELKARFDEKWNAEWARALAAAGARVIHAPAGVKVHAKMLLVERREGGRLRRYAHVSSGNYNAFTSLVYTDFGLLTCDNAMTSDVAEVFHSLEQNMRVPRLREALAAPFGLRRGFRALVEREVAWAERGEAGHLILKMNALIDQPAIDLLYRASQAGVQVDLIVRGVCDLRPGIPGLSDRIRVRSIVGRFLEHSRAWYFRNGGAEEVFIGSADLRPRNFDRRVELMVPVKDRALVHRLRYEILDRYLLDTLSARELLPNGRYRRVASAIDGSVNVQSAFLDLQSTLTDAGSDDQRDHYRASHVGGGHAGTRALCVG